MPVRTPRSASFWVVCLEDDALDDVPAEVMRAYESTRDYSLLEPHLEGVDPPPTRFFCRPLMAQYQRKVPALMVPQADVDDLWELFATHVEKVEGLLDSTGRKIDAGREGKGSNRRIPDRYRADEDGNPIIPMDVFREVARAVIHFGTRSDSTPFTSLGMWASSRLNRTRAHHVRGEAAALLERIAERSRIALSRESETSEPSTEIGETSPSSEALDS